jgi:small subunit ribosomal protein S20
MANTVSSIKRVRQTKHKTEINRFRKTRLKNVVRAMRRSLEKKDAAGSEKLLPATYSMIDRAAKWGIIKKNTAARYKSRISARLRSLATA